ncbi:tetratricopeptide repeat protein 36 isoform X2 [Marmota monax]|uniref:tetratricopeptide repeat protein 36 isoform X2 n=1 Tax=Marmota monax TaxID=9995 RepID=UPI001EAFAABD|nr:tetratricopeptide repeat protein 36 isoform X2 [Marmota monax]XP_048651595.1 tetratricopeptide repeat protein 36 isoform X2 [Marmota marmota marmota]
MGTPNDQAVLQAIFNPDTPFGDVFGFDLGEEAEKEEADEGAQADLDRALALSGGRGRAARQGFVQRGLLARLQGRDDDARRDFEQAARLGSPFARRQLVLLNPYAALCNRMLADMMGQLRSPRNGR